MHGCISERFWMFAWCSIVLRGREKPIEAFLKWVAWRDMKVESRLPNVRVFYRRPA
jgi:hypothetical protein